MRLPTKKAVAITALITLTFTGASLYGKASTMSDEVDSMKAHMEQLAKDVDHAKVEQEVRIKQIPSHYKELEAQAKRLIEAEGVMTIEMDKQLKEDKIRPSQAFIDAEKTMNTLLAPYESQAHRNSTWRMNPKWSLQLMKDTTMQTDTLKPVFAIHNEKGMLAGMVTSEYNLKEKTFANLQTYLTKIGKDELGKRELDVSNEPQDPDAEADLKKQAEKEEPSKNNTKKDDAS